MALGELSIDVIADVAKFKAGLTGEALAAVEQFERQASAGFKKVDQALNAVDPKRAEQALKDLRKEVIELKGVVGASADDLGKFGAKVDEYGRLILDTAEDVEAARASIDRFVDSTRGIERLKEVGSVLSGFSQGVLEISGSINDATEKSRNFERSLKAAFGDAAPQAKALLDEFGSLEQLGGPEAVEEGLKKLNAFGAFTEERFRLIADISAKTGENIAQISEQFGEALKTGNYAPLEGIGITAKELEKFGAFLDENNQILTDTPLRAEAARKALDALARDGFAGASDNLKTPVTELNRELEALKTQLGAGTDQAKNYLAEAILPLVKGVQDLPAPMKAFAGLTLEALGQGSGAAAGAIELGANVRLLTQGLNLGKVASSAMALAQTGLAGAIGLTTLAMAAAVVGVAALAVGFHAYTQELNNATKAAEDLLSIEEKRLKAYREGADWIGKNADELRKLGVTSQQYSLTLQGLQDAINQAPNEAVKARLQEKLNEGRKVLKELQVAEAEARGGKSGTAGQALAPAASQKSIAEIAEEQKGATGPAAPGRKPPDESEKEKKAREAQEKADADKARKEKLAEELAAIDQEDARHQLTTAAKLDRYRKLLEANKASLAPEERRNIEGKIAALEGKLLDEREKRKEDARKRNYQAELDNINQLAAVRDIDKKRQIQLLEDVLTRRKAANSITLEEERSLLNQLSSLRGQVRDEEKRNAEKDAEDARKQAEKNAQDLDRARQEGRTLAQDRVSDKISDLQERRDQGAPVGRQIEDAIKERLRLQEEDIRAEAAAAAQATESEEARAQIVANANEKIAAARREATKALEEEYDAQDALKRKQAETDARGPRAFENRGGTFQSYDQVQQDLSDQFGIDATRARIAEQVARNRAASAGLSTVDRNEIKAAGAIGAAPKIDSVADLTAELAKVIQQPTTVVLEVQEGGRTTRTEQTTRPGEPTKFDHRLGGTTG